jgi:Flp pilus assembly protein TadG
MSRIKSGINNLLRCSNGIAAMEFALVAPVLLLLFLGTFEMGSKILVSQKTDKVSNTLSDVIAQSQTITDSQITMLFSAANDIMKPYTFPSDGFIIVTSVSKTGTNPPAINWQRSGGGNLTGKTSLIGSPGLTPTLPETLTLNDKDNVIIAEVFYRYTPSFAAYLFQSDTIYRVSYFKPRLGALTTSPT